MKRRKTVKHARRKAKEAAQPDLPALLPDKAPEPPATRAGRAIRLLTGYPMVIAIVAIYWLMAVTSVLDKSSTSDEVVHLPAGYSFWKYNDYRMDPENGNLPQRWMALPLLFGQWQFPSHDEYYWKMSREWRVGRWFFFFLGNDLQKMLWQGRAMIALLGCFAGLLVYTWARFLFGRIGGMISLLLFAFDPTMLANGRLCTSDMAAGLFFTLSLGCLWWVLHKVNWLSLLCSCLAMGGLFIAKMSGVLIIPIGLALVGIRLLSGRPIQIAFGETMRVASRTRQAMVYLALVVLHAGAAILIIWAAFGFRFSMFSPASGTNNYPPQSWEELTADKSRICDTLLFARKHKLLPEAYLYGFGHVYKYSLARSAFLNGEYSLYGWRRFFPYCFLVKTPLPTMALAGLAIAVAYLRNRASGRAGTLAFFVSVGKGLYRSAPLWVLLVVYWWFSISAHINIGHRHILPTYLPTFILAGAAAYWFGARVRWTRLLVPAMLVWLVVESVAIWPHYLAYFNQVVGGPRNGYKHLVDSSLDWGQDLPGLKKWIERNTDKGDNVYLGYFGNNVVQYWQVPAIRISGWPDMGRANLAPAMLPGTYCVSATQIQTVLIKPWGPWTAQYENAYWGLMADLPELKKTIGDARGRDEFFKSVKDEETFGKLKLFDQLQFARLAAMLRQREPDDYVGYSILIYKLTEDDLLKALLGPPPELVPLQIRRR